MRSDKLKRHQLTHKDILSMTDDKIRQELRVRNASRVFREEQGQKVEEIAQQEDITLNICIQSHIFLFNDTRAGGETGQNYAVLEHIKDGCALFLKYSSNVINFKTPNIIILFSNNSPHTSYLSADRWRVYAIKEDGLRCVNNGRNISLRKDEYIAYGIRTFDKHLTFES